MNSWPSQFEGFDAQFKAMTGQINVDEAEGIVECFVAAIGNKDSVGDIILPGAFNGSLRRRKPRVVWGHNWNEPIGKVLDIYEVGPADPRLPRKMREAGVGGLFAKVQFNLRAERGRQAFLDVSFFGEEQEWCVDADTEILTSRGWLRYDEIRETDEAYVLDPELGWGRFEPIEAVNVWPEKTRSLRHIQTGGFSSLTTAAHRWPTASNADGGKVRWTTTEALDSTDRIIRAAARSDAPVVQKYTDSFVELVGWFWTEGWTPPDDHTDAGLYLAQSTAKNPQHVASIRTALQAEFPGHWSERHSKDEMARFRITREAAQHILGVTGSDKQPTPEFLLDLTRSQLLLLIDTCLSGDGHRSKSGQETWYQVAEAGVRAFEMLCALAGRPTNTTSTKDYGNRFGAPPQRVSLLRSGVAKPLDAIRVKGYGYKSGAERTPAIDEWVETEGIVWCPTTPSGTWLARRDGSVYFTGNSIGYKTIEADYDNIRKANLLKQVELYEVSPVLHGANQLTSTLSIKADELPSTSEDEMEPEDEKSLAQALAKMLGGAVRIRRMGDGEAEYDHMGDSDDKPTRAVIPYSRSGERYSFGPATPRNWEEDDEEEEEYEEAEGGMANTQYPVTSRQRTFYDAIEMVVEKYGRFDQSVGPDGAHYVEKSPFEDEGLVCSNCLFYSGGRSCEVVEGDIAPEGICKLWQIPAVLVKGKDDVRGEGADAPAADPTEEMSEEEREAMAETISAQMGMPMRSGSSEEKGHAGGCGPKCRCGGYGGEVKPTTWEGEEDDVDEVLEEARTTQQSSLARAVSRELGLPVLVRSASANTVVFDVMTSAGRRTMRSSWHAERGEIMVGRPEPVREETIFLPMTGGNGQGYKDDGGEIKAPQDVVLDLPQEAFTGEVLRGYGPRRGNLERLLRYWRPIMRKPGGFRRCLVILADHPELYPLQNLCAWLHHETTGLWPNEGCHHPGMKNCRRKLRGVVRGSIWNDREWNDRLRRITGGRDGKGMGWVYDDDDEWGDDVDWDNFDWEMDEDERERAFRRMLQRGRAELVKFCKSEPEFAAYVSDVKNWYVEGDRDDGTTGTHAVMKDYCVDCGDSKTDDSEDELVKDLDAFLTGFSEKAGRALSGRNLERLRQALMLLQEVLAAGGEPMEMKAKSDSGISYSWEQSEDESYVFAINAPIEEIFNVKSFIDPVLSFYDLEARIHENGITVDGFGFDAEDVKEVLVKAVKGIVASDTESAESETD